MINFPYENKLNRDIPSEPISEEEMQIFSNLKTIIKKLQSNSTLDKDGFNNRLIKKLV